MQQLKLPTFNRLNDKAKVTLDSSLSLNHLVVGGSLKEVLESSHFITYQGSTTYAPCNEEVEWIVLLTTFQNLGHLQLGDLELVSGTKNNARPLQNLNSRPLYIY